VLSTPSYSLSLPSLLAPTVVYFEFVTVSCFDISRLFSSHRSSSLMRACPLSLKAGLSRGPVVLCHWPAASSRYDATGRGRSDCAVPPYGSLRGSFYPSGQRSYLLAKVLAWFGPPATTLSSAMSLFGGRRSNRTRKKRGMARRRMRHEAALEWKPVEVRI
jgi:hypothetical protein